METRGVSPWIEMYGLIWVMKSGLRLLLVKASALFVYASETVRPRLMIQPGAG